MKENQLAQFDLNDALTPIRPDEAAAFTRLAAARATSPDELEMFVAMALGGAS